MSTQRYISTSFWDDGWIQSIDPSEKLLYLYLMTNPLTNIAGIYKITDKRIHDDTGFSVDMLHKLLSRFEQAKKAYRFGEYIILPNWPKHQKWREKKTIETGIRKILAELPNSIRDKAIKVGYLYPIDTVPISYPYSPSYLNSDIDIDSDIDTDIPSATPPKPEQDESFKAFYDAYPRKEARGQALKAYKAARRKGTTAETILERLETYKARLDRDGTDRKYMRLPATFLHNLDDYERAEPDKPTAPPEREIETVTVPPEIMAAILRSQQPVNKTEGDDESCK